TDSATHSTPHADMDTSAVRTTLGMLKQEVPMDATTVTIAAVVAVFAPLWTPANVALAIMFFLSCTLDHVCGIGAAYVEGQSGTWWDGRKFWTGIVKKLLLFSLSIVAALVDVAAALVPAFEALENTTPAAKFVLAALIMGQFHSIVRNVKRATGGGPVIDFLLRKLGDSADSHDPE